MIHYIIACLGHKVKMHKKQKKKPIEYVIVCEMQGRSFENPGKSPVGLANSGLRAYNSPRAAGSGGAGAETFSRGGG